MTKQGSFIDFTVDAPNVEFTENIGAIFKKVYPVEIPISPEKAHLMRPVELKNGITFTI